MPHPPSNTNLRGEIETELVSSGVLVTSMRGYMTGQHLSDRLEQFRALVEQTHCGTWIIDSLDLTGFEPASVARAALWFDLFKQRQGVHILFVSNLPPARMAAATLAFAVHVKITCCRELSRAYEEAGVGTRSVRPSQFTLSPPKSSAEG